MSGVIDRIYVCGGISERNFRTKYLSFLIEYGGGTVYGPLRFCSCRVFMLKEGFRLRFRFENTNLDLNERILAYFVFQI